MSQVNDTTKKTICQHLNEAEREIIERQLALGTPKKQIARLLGRNISTIRREIKRGCGAAAVQTESPALWTEVPLYGMSGIRTVCREQDTR